MSQLGVDDVYDFYVKTAVAEMGDSLATKDMSQKLGAVINYTR